TSLLLRYARHERDCDLAEAVAMLRESLNAIAVDHPNRGQALVTFGRALHTRAKRTGDVADFDEAIVVFRDALGSIPADAGEHGSCLFHLGMSLAMRCERRNDAEEIDEAVDLLRNACTADLRGDPDRGKVLNILGGALGLRFQFRGNKADIDAAVAAGRESTTIVPAGHQGYVESRSGLATVLHSRFARYGDLADLDEAIALRFAVVDDTSDDHPQRGQSLTNLGYALQDRFERIGRRSDLDEAIRVGRAALDVLATGNPNYAMALTNLGKSLILRFWRTLDDADLGDAITAWRDAVAVAPSDHRNRAMFLANLGYALQTRYARSAEPADLDEAIAIGRDAAIAAPPTHPNYGLFLTNLGRSLAMRFDRLKEPDDLHEAVRFGQEAVAATPADNPQHAQCQYLLGSLLALRFELTGNTTDLHEAVRAAREAVAVSSAPVGIRILAAQMCANALVYLRRNGSERTGTQTDTDDPIGFAEALPMYRTAIELLPLLAMRGLDREDQRHQLENAASSLGRDAAACAIAVGDNDLAVSLLEQNRAVMWNQLLELRSDLTALRTAYPEIAAEFERCRSVLDGPGDESGMISDPQSSGQDPADRIAAGNEFDALVARIRALPAIADFPEPDRFLQPPPIGEVLPPPGSGPLIVVNIGTWRCDALVLDGDGITRVPLSVKAKEVYEHAGRYVKALQRFTGPSEAVSLEMATRPVLEWMWDAIAEPVLDAIADRLNGTKPRVWWCPTGPLTLLPLHAAGYHPQADGRAVIDRVVSSYTPTLRALADARSRTPGPDSPKLLIVSVTETPKATDGDPEYAVLPGAASEQRLLTTMVDADRTTVLSNDKASRAAIVAGLDDHHWVHIACHGTQDLVHPTAGGLVPFDWRSSGLIGVNDLAGSGAGGQFAFLSACQTATGGATNLDEAITVTAAMQHSGWRHVIGTLWTISDSSASRIAEDVYRRIAPGGHLDPTHSARALHDAVRALRRENRDHAAQWARYVHTGP
ncbi:MAG: CHAT domain-containing protein, partial [Stackebrandtia sp.]